MMLPMLLAVVTCNSLAQGIIIYKSNGTQEKLPYVAVDSILMYYADKDPVPVIEPKAVDLGLPSGTLWASHNVGATTPETIGGYYAYGETTEKLTYNWDTYMCTQAQCGTSSDPLYADGLLTFDTYYGITTGYNCNIAGTKYDVATQTWGESWVMPTQEQYKELINYCTCSYKPINDSYCAEYTGPNGNSLIIPLNTGYKQGQRLSDPGILNESYYWCSDIYNNREAYDANLSYHSSSISYDSRYLGLQIRPVKRSDTSGGETTDEPGTKENPFTSAEANAYGSSLGADEVSEDDCYIKGKVVSIKEQFGTQYGNATFYISEDGSAKDQFYVYRANYLGNKNYSGESLVLNVGDEVVICGKITNYQGYLPETVQNNAYVVSINGVTSN